MPKTFQTEGNPWWEWLSAKLAEAHISPAELARRSDGRIKDYNVSAWKSGKHGADTDSVIAVVEVLNIDPANLAGETAEALRVIGRDNIANLIDPASLPAGLPRIDPNVTEIMGWTHLSASVREVLLLQYRRGQQAALEQARTTARLLAERGENGDSGNSAA